MTRGGLELPPGYKPLTTVGYRWPCGCEALGAASLSWITSCVWAACAEHNVDRKGPTFVRTVEARGEDTIVLRGDAAYRPGEILVKQVSE